MKNKLFIILSLGFLFVTFSRVSDATTIVNTGDNFCLTHINDPECPTASPTPTPPINLDFPCEENCFPTITIPTIVIPTISEDKGNESNGNIDLCALRGCPTATPTPTVTPQPSVTPTSRPTPTNTPAIGGSSNDGSSSGSSSSSSSSSGGGQILGTSTMAATGVFTDTVMNAAALTGLLAIAVAARRYAQETR